MKIFLKSLMLFLLPILITGTITEVLLRRIPNDYQYKNQYLHENAERIEVLFLGSSHVFYGIDPKYMRRKSFNAAYISQTLNYDHQILKKHENNWDSLKYIVLPVDYFSLYSTLETGIEAWRVKNYTIYCGLNSNHISDYFEIFSNKLDLNLGRLRSYYFLHEPSLTCSEYGWGTEYTYKKRKDLLSSGIKNAKRHSMPDGRYLKENIRTLESIIEFAGSKNISVILITSPAYKTYVERLNPKQLNTTIAAVNKLCKSHKNVFYYNFLNDKRFAEQDFYDADHLDEYGTKVLSRGIDSLIDQLKEDRLVSKTKEQIKYIPR